MRLYLSATYKCKALWLLLLTSLPIPFRTHMHFILWNQVTLGLFHSLWSHVLGSLCADRLSQTSVGPFWLPEHSAKGQMGTMYVNIPFVRLYKGFMWKILCGDIRTLLFTLLILFIPGIPGRHYKIYIDCTMQKTLVIMPSPFPQGVTQKYIREKLAIVYKQWAEHQVYYR